MPVAPLVAFAIATALGIAWTVSASSAAPQQYASYHNDRWHFSLAAPLDVTVETFDYADGGQQFSFGNGSGTQLFTVTAVPYSQLTSPSAAKENRAQRPTSPTILRS